MTHQGVIRSRLVYTSTDLKQGYDVHVLVDAVSSQRPYDRAIAIQVSFFALAINHTGLCISRTLCGPMHIQAATAAGGFN